MILNHGHYLKKDQYGREVFDYRAYEDDEQMQILSQTRQNLKRNCLASHNRGLLSFIKRLRRTRVCTK